MTREEIINGMKMTMELILFDPSTGETKEPHQLNDMDRTTYDACKGAIEALEKQEQDRWIPVTERLPKVHESGNSVSGIFMESDPVLVYGTAEYEEEGQFHVVTYCDDLDGNTYWSTELDALTIKGVKAWRPLPENYTEEEA